MVCSSVRSPKIAGVWNTRATPAWLIRCGDRPSSEVPLNSTLPVSCFRRPTKQLSSVDLPAPFGPMMACTEPSSTVRLTSLRARRPAKLLFTFLTCRMLMAGPSFGAVRLLDRHPGPVRLGPAAEQAGQPRKSLDHAAGHEDDDQHEDRAEGQVPAVDRKRVV